MTGSPGADRRVTAIVSYFRDGSNYPRSGPPDRQNETYWANIAANAATWRHVAGPDAEFVVFCGAEPPSDAASVLDRANARTRILDFDRRPPDDFYTRYLGALYLLDVMAALADEVDDDDVLLFVDPDIVWARPPAPLIGEIERGGIVCYDLLVPDHVPLCDLTRQQQSQILREITGDGPPVGGTSLAHFGGEFYGMLGSELKTLVPAYEVLWTATMERYQARLPHYHFEEHVLNGVLWQRGEQHGRANAHLQRIRTLPKPYGTRERAHNGLVAWHLPNEKDAGFLRLFDELRAGEVMPAAGPDYVRWLARRMGIAPAGRRWLLDRARQLKWIATREYWTGDTNHGL